MTHLEPFGRTKWGVPVAGIAMFLLVWRWSRRARPAVVAAAAVTRSATAAPKRSEPLKNPLAGWKSTAPAEAPPVAKPVNPLVVSATLSRETAPPVAPLTLEPSRPRGRRLVIAVVVIAAGMLFAFRTTIWNQRPVTDMLRTIDLDSIGAVTFLEIAPPGAAELPKLHRFDTLQRSAPQPIAPPSDTVALRSAARWPNDRVIVRQRSEVARLSDIDPPQSKSTRLTTLARKPVKLELSRPHLRPPEAALVAVVSPVPEKLHAVAPTTTAQQAFVPSATERTTVPNAAANQAVLRAPAARAIQLMLASANLSPSAAVSYPALLARSGAASRVAAPSNLVELEALSGLAPVATIELPLPAQSLSVSRTEAALIGKPTTSNDITARSLLPPSRTVATVTEPSVSSTAADAPTVPLPAKSLAVPKVVPLTEEVVPPVTSATPEATNSNAASAPSRIESPGPQPNLPTTLVAANTARVDVAASRSPSRIESVESSARTPENRFAPAIARRDSPLPVFAAVAAESTAGAMPDSPAILLTSATMLVELLASATMTPLPRSESVGPMPTVATSSVSEFARWLSRIAPLTALREPRSEIELRSPTSNTAIPRVTRTLMPAELPEVP